MRRLIAASLCAGFFVAALASAHQRRGCSELFTVRMGMRAGRAVYGGTRKVGVAQLRTLGYIERCQRNPMAQGFVRWFDRRLGREHAARLVLASVARLPRAVASWYEDAGSTACGFHAGYGVAHKSLRCGTRVLICYPAGSSRCVQTVVDDRGPYIAGRDWDLNQATAAALGFNGVDTVSYRIE